MWGSLMLAPHSAMSLWYGAGECGGEGGSGGRGTLTCGPAEPLEVVDEVVAGAGEGGLEVLVAGDEGGETGQALLARAAHAHESVEAPMSISWRTISLVTWAYQENEGEISTTLWESLTIVY